MKYLAPNGQTVIVGVPHFRRPRFSNERPFGLGAGMDAIVVGPGNVCGPFAIPIPEGKYVDYAWVIKSGIQHRYFVTFADLSSAQYARSVCQRTTGFSVGGLTGGEYYNYYFRALSFVLCYGM